jgi:hypothetical protein
MVTVQMALGLIWLAVSFWSQWNPTARKVFSYLGSIVTLVHVAGLAGGMLQNWLGGRSSVEGGVNMAGFVVGCALGVILGSVVGGVAAKMDLLYWAVQIVAAAFIVFLPLFRW